MPLNYGVRRPRPKERVPSGSAKDVFLLLQTVHGFGFGRLPPITKGPA